METRKVDVKITNPDGSIIFKKDGFEVPESWSDRAATIVASKYAMDSENSAIDIIDRVVNQITEWGKEQGYFHGNNGYDNDIFHILPETFSNKLKDILINQRAAFNSPVWFNVGADTGTNQCSACFILPVEDTMESILQHYTTEGMIFRGGSGAGINVSKLRAKGEKLSNKGESSGPISFMKGWDSNAGTIKSGGKVRRAAKMVCMDADHPDIMEFIECKKIEEDKAKILIASGISPEEAYATVAFQNTNHSIRVTDNFMEQAEKDATWKLWNRRDGQDKEIGALEILNKAAEIAWETGDPGIQFDDAMNNANPIPNTDKINSTNPCSEFSAVDNSSCNLASLNLLKYYHGTTDVFDYDKFKEDIQIIITAMDILVDAADYPIEAVRKMTVSTRPLGLGFANLGALLIMKGLPYDSQEARYFASNLTKNMTTYAYEQSIELAKKLGSFSEFEYNNTECIDVAYKLTQSKYISESIKKYGLRNSQLTLVAPTGTIGFMMDCDTFGIEPLFALKTIKTLSGGGVMEIDYPCVEKYRDLHKGKFPIYKPGETDPVDFARGWNPEVLKTANEISWKAHIDMMAACQKYLNGAISKTVNMPSDATVEDIKEAYIYAWKSGLKCLAIYRDGSKGMQPYKSSKESDKDNVEDSILEDESLERWSALRRKLPETRQSVTHKFNVGGLEGYFTIGMYEDGNPGEIFIRTQKQGSTMQGVLDAFATAVSLALQYGVPITTMIEKFVGSKFEPSGFTPNEDIRFTSSVMDYIFRWLQMNFVDEEDESLYETEVTTDTTIKPTTITTAKYDGPPCTNCGSMTSRSGTCYICTQCGETTGCS